MALCLDTFDDLVELLKENIRTIGSDVDRLAEQHRQDIERLSCCQLPPVGKEELRLLQPLLAADFGVDVELPPVEFQRLRAEFDNQTSQDVVSVVPKPPQAEAVPLDESQEFPDVPGVVQKDSPRGVTASPCSVVPTPSAPLGAHRLPPCVPIAHCPPSKISVVADAGKTPPVSARPKGHPQKAVSFADLREVEGAVQPEGADMQAIAHTLSQRDPDEVGRRELRDRLRKSKHTPDATGADADRTRARSTGGRFSSFVDGVTSTMTVRRGVLPDVIELKEQVQKTIAKPQPSVVDLYATEGVWQAIARSNLFDCVTVMVTFLNAVWIGIEMDGNTAVILIEAEPIYQVCEHIFCVFFVCEWLIRFLAFARKRDCYKDYWFIFDSLLALMLVVDTWVMTIVALSLGTPGRGLGTGDASILRMLKMARLVRLARMSKLLRAFPELLVLIRGIGIAVRSVFFTLCLQLFVVYVFSVCFKRLTESSKAPTALFPDVLTGMKTLVLSGILPDFSPMIESLGDAGPIAAFAAFAFVLLASITIMNFIIGVLVEVVKVTSTVEREHLQASYVRRHLNELLKEIGIVEENHPYLHPSDFEAFLLHPRAASYMQDMGVDVVGLVDFFDVMFRNGEDFPLSDFFRLVLALRGTNPTTVKDMVDLRAFLVTELKELEENLLRHMVGLSFYGSTIHGVGQMRVTAVE